MFLIEYLVCSRAFLVTFYTVFNLSFFPSVYHHLPSYLVDMELNFPYFSTAWKVLCEHNILEWRCTHPPSSVLPIYIPTCCFIWDISWPRAIFNQYMNSKLKITIYLCFSPQGQSCKWLAPTKYCQTELNLRSSVSWPPVTGAYQELSLGDSERQRRVNRSFHCFECLNL